MSGLTEFIYNAPFEFLSSHTALGSFDKLHIIVTHRVLQFTKEPQPNRLLEPKPSIARLTRMTSPSAMSSSPSPVPVGAVFPELL